MKTLFFFVLTVTTSILHAQTFNLDRDFGTYFGDERFSLQSSVVDGNGDLYIVGYIRYENYGDATEDYTYFDNSPHQSEFAGGHSDGYIAKFNAEGELLWATLFGGEGIDVIENITTDEENNIYIMGATNSHTGISTSNAYQPEKLGAIDLFISKFNTNGEIIWSTYFGSADNTDGNDIYNEYLNENFPNLQQDGNYIIHDKESHLYLTSSWRMLNNTETIPSYNDTIGNNHIVKFTQDGELVWCTSYGVNLNNITGACWGGKGLIINGQVITMPAEMDMGDDDDTYYGEEDAYQSVAPSVGNLYIAKFSPDGVREWGTYYGSGEGTEMTWHNSIACDGLGSFYIFNHKSGLELFSTPGAFQEELNEDYNNLLFTKFTETPEGEKKQERNWATYYGLGDGVNSSTYASTQAVTYGEDDYIYISGVAAYPDNMTTEGAWQETIPELFRQNGFIAKFDSEGNRIWGTYYNGEDNSKNVKALPYGVDEHFYITGGTLSNTQMSTEDALQPNRIVWDDDPSLTSGTFGIFIAHFSPIVDDEDDTSNLSPETLAKNVNIYPNPNDGSFTISSKENIEEISIYSIQGQLVKNQVLDVPLTEIKIEDLQAGAYFVTLKLRGNQMISKKVFVN